MSHCITSWQLLQMIQRFFCNLLGRKLINCSDNDDEGFLGSPAMVARPLDFRTIDLRLAAGAYGGSHEAFFEDVHEVCVLSKLDCLTVF
ncbi:putative histone acetyltransferase [Lupinus albus]|uniref:Putative histone acetyltransferase n=1 Tax=Lupinus albus TaxID=3870 RepID=A0A6A4R249_LUPAL|nr:putative histone acetyltransferase [Lupinus albus]